MENIEIINTPSLDIEYYLAKIFNFVSTFFGAHGGDFGSFFRELIGAVVGISIPISIFFLIAIVITVESLKRVRNLESEMFLIPPHQEEAVVKVDTEQAKRWRKVMEQTESQNPSDWRQAIVEADIMLEQLLVKLGYQGTTIGEKLNRASKGDFKTLQQAFDAHRVRNRIAHDGSDFEINQFETNRVIGLYRQVFEEFYHISEK